MNVHLTKLSDTQLLQQFSNVIKKEKQSIAWVIAHLSEIDKRKLYLKEAYPSLFQYCVEKFHYS